MKAHALCSVEGSVSRLEENEIVNGNFSHSGSNADAFRKLYGGWGQRVSGL